MFLELGLWHSKLTFNNISVISWRSGLLDEETGVHGEKTKTCRKSLTNFNAVSNKPRHE